MRLCLLALSAALALSAPAPAFASATVQSPAASAPAEEPQVVVPAWPNPTCPVMGKPVSNRLYTDTRRGRIYICCKACVKDIQDDVEVNYRAAYPTTKEAGNKTCPVTGKELPKEPVTVLLQGHSFQVVDRAAEAVALSDAQATLAKLFDSKLVDLGNKTCPASGEAVAANTIVVYDGRIVRLSSSKAVEEFKKDPKKLLAKALEIRAKQDAEEAERAKKAQPAPERKDPKAAAR